MGQGKHLSPALIQLVGPDINKKVPARTQDN